MTGVSLVSSSHLRTRIQFTFPTPRSLSLVFQYVLHLIAVLRIRRQVVEESQVLGQASRYVLARFVCPPVPQPVPERLPRRCPWGAAVARRLRPRDVGVDPVAENDSELDDRMSRGVAARWRGVFGVRGSRRGAVCQERTEVRFPLHLPGC